MHQKKILVPVGSSATNLKSVYYALALADRLDAHIHILQQAPPQKTATQQSVWFHETLQDLINDARQSDILVSQYTVNTNFKDEIVALVRSEHIDLLVFSADPVVSEELLLQITPLIPSQIIQVREKDEIHCIKEGDKSYGSRHDLQFVPGRPGRAGPYPGRQNPMAGAHARRTAGAGERKRHKSRSS